MQDLEYIYKIVLLGDAAVGKTSLRRRFMGKGFKTKYMGTIGADFVLKHMGNIGLHIWDLAGHQGFQSVRSFFYRGAKGALIVYDITNRKSLHNVINWIEELFKVVKKKIPIVFVGNKIDLREEGLNHVSQKDGKNYINKFEDIIEDHIFIETSALTGVNVNEAFHKLIKFVKKQNLIE